MNLFSNFGKYISWSHYCKKCNCSVKNLGFCQDCLNNLPRNSKCCVVCAATLPHSAVCTNCLKNQPTISKVVAPFIYKEPLDGLIKGLKYNHKLINANILAELMLPYLTNNKTDCLIGVPLHPKRLVERGFNQSVEIAKILSKKLGIPLEKNYVRRVRNTQQQFKLNKQLRNKQMKNAFLANSQFNEFEGKSIAIIDDIMTTGATVNSLARALKRANKSVYVECWVPLRAAL